MVYGHFFLTGSVRKLRLTPLCDLPAVLKPPITAGSRQVPFVYESARLVSALTDMLAFLKREGLSTRSCTICSIKLWREESQTLH